jgi:sulfotransferase
MKKYNFISGLPRSGSTLLSSILRQNPRFTAEISDPLHSFCHSIIKDTNTAVGMDAAVPVDKRKRLMRDMFDSFYKDGNEVCFNTNRSWSADTSLLKDLFPDFKMIVTLREVEWVIDSFEQLNHKNPYTIKPLYHHQELQTVYQRSNMLMGQIPNFGGYVEGPLVCTKQSVFCTERDQICFVEYETLVRNPQAVMKQIYEFLGEPWFEHDFNNVENSYDEFDQQAKIEGLHTVKKKVQYYPRRTILPGDLFANLQQQNFWKYPEFEQVKKELNWITSSTKTQSPRPVPPVVTQRQFKQL